MSLQALVAWIALPTRIQKRTHWSSRCVSGFSKRSIRNQRMPLLLGAFSDGLLADLDFD